MHIFEFTQQEKEETLVLYNKVRELHNRKKKKRWYFIIRYANF